MMLEPGRRSAVELLDRMFEVELRFLQSATADLALLATAFHPDVVVHEPQSLPYAGDWKGLEGVGALFRRMREVWSNLSVEGLEAARDGDTVFMTCTLHLTARQSGNRITQPFAEVLRFKESRLVEGTPFYHDTAQIAAAVA
jgi:ketosteroid isomerase-like protein